MPKFSRSADVTPRTGEGAPLREKGGAARIPNHLLAIGSAAVLTIYGAGFERTRAAADKFADDADAHARRPSQQLVDASDGGRGGRGGRGAPPATPPLATEPPDAGRATASLTPSRGAATTTAATRTGREGPPEAVASSPAPSERSKAVTTVSVTDSSVAPAPAIAPAAAVAPAAAPALAVTAPTSAPPSAPAPAAPKPAPAPAQQDAERSRSPWHDGSYTGWGTSRHGDIEATVVIAEGRIVSAQISRCLTRYSCSWIAHLQQQVVVRQSADVDFVSGATQSTNAFYYAVVEALNKSR